MLHWTIWLVWTKVLLACRCCFTFFKQQLLLFHANAEEDGNDKDIIDKNAREKMLTNMTRTSILKVIATIRLCQWKCWGSNVCDPNLESFQNRWAFDFICWQSSLDCHAKLLSSKTSYPGGHCGHMPENLPNRWSSGHCKDIQGCIPRLYLCYSAMGLIHVNRLLQSCWNRGHCTAGRTTGLRLTTG